MDLKELESGVDPKTHWYYQTKKEPLISFVKQVFRKTRLPLTLVDVGSGSGFFMYELVEEIPEMIRKVYLVDIGYGEQEVNATSNQLVEKTRALPDHIENAVVVMMDVLEHLKEDAAMLQSIRKNSAGTNYFFITVPAFQSLWSGHDVYLGHYRRYTLRSLSNLLKQSQFHLQSDYYFFGFIFPLAWVVRRFSDKKNAAASDMKPAGGFLNALLLALCLVELPFRKANRLAGVTAVAEGSF
jgi:hypothetical protein